MMSDKNWVGLTPLPSGQFADYVWDGLSETMRNVFRHASEVGVDEYLMGAKAITLSALIKRKLVGYRESSYRLTEDGKALVEWMKNKERNT